MASLSAERNVLDERQDVKRIGAPLNPLGAMHPSCFDLVSQHALMPQPACEPMPMMWNAMGLSLTGIRIVIDLAA